MNTTISGSMKAIQGDLPLRFQNDFGSNPGNIAFFPYGTYETRRQYVPRSSRGAPGKPHQARCFPLRSADHKIWWSGELLCQAGRDVGAEAAGSASLGLDVA
jgi:hypothetical protein